MAVVDGQLFVWRPTEVLVLLELLALAPFPPLFCVELAVVKELLDVLALAFETTCA
jgi:hypothetical protein